MQKNIPISIFAKKRIVIVIMNIRHSRDVFTDDIRFFPTSLSCCIVVFKVQKVEACCGNIRFNKGSKFHSVQQALTCS